MHAECTRYQPRSRPLLPLSPLPRALFPPQGVAAALLLLLAAAASAEASPAGYYYGTRRLQSVGGGYYGGYYSARRLSEARPAAAVVTPMMLSGARRLFGAWEPLSVPLPSRLSSFSTGRTLAGYYVSGREGSRWRGAAMDLGRARAVA